MFYTKSSAFFVVIYPPASFHMEDDPCIYHVSRRNAFVPFMHAESDHVADDKDGSLRPAEGADTVLIVDDEGSGPDYNTESTTG